MAYLFDTGIFAVNTSTGAVAPGATLTFYTAGTTSLLDTYSTDALDPLLKNTNPVVADGSGVFGPIWLSDVLYKVKLTLPDGSTRTRDNVGDTVRVDLASTASGKGASLVGKTGGGTLQDVATIVDGLDDTSGTQGAQRIGYKSPLTNAVASTVYAAVKARRATAEGDFSVVFDDSTTNTTALQNALNALSSAGGGTLELSIGVARTGTLTRPENVSIIGQGKYSTRLKATTGLNAPVIQTAGSSGTIINRGGIEGLTIVGSGLANTLCYGIKDLWTNRAVYRDIDIHGCYIGMYASNVWQNVWDNIHVHGGGSDQNAYGFWMAEVDPSNQNNAVIANGCVAQGVTAAAFRLINFNGSKFSSCEGLNGTHGWYLGDPTTGTEKVRWGHFVNCLGDTNSTYNWLVEKGSATSLEQIQFSNCWGGTATSTSGASFKIGGASQILLDNCHSIASRGYGFHLNQCSRIGMSNIHVRDWDYTNAGGSLCGILLADTTITSIVGLQEYNTISATKGLIETGTSNNNMIGPGTYGPAGATIIGGATTATGMKSV